MHLPTSARSIPVRTESRISTCCTEAGAIWRMWVQTSRRYIEFQFFYSIERRAIWVLKFKLLNKNSKLKLKIKIRMGTRFPRGWRRNSSTSWRPWPKASLCQAMRSKSWRSSMTERATSQGYHFLELNIIHRKRILTSILVQDFDREVRIVLLMLQNTFERCLHEMGIERALKNKPPGSSPDIYPHETGIAQMKNMLCRWMEFSAQQQPWYEDMKPVQLSKLQQTFFKSESCTKSNNDFPF